MHRDEVGNEIVVGDFVMVTALDANRGAYLNMTQAPCQVVSISGRTRITIQVPSLNGPSTVGPERVKVIRASDGRLLRTWADVHSEQKGTCA